MFKVGQKVRLRKNYKWTEDYGIIKRIIKQQYYSFLIESSLAVIEFPNKVFGTYPLHQLEPLDLREFIKEALIILDILKH